MWLYKRIILISWPQIELESITIFNMERDDIVIAYLDMQWRLEGILNLIEARLGWLLSYGAVRKPGCFDLKIVCLWTRFRIR